MAVRPDFAWCRCSNLGVELQPADAQVHPREALVRGDGVDLDELVFPYGRPYGSVRLVVVQVEGFLGEQGALSSA